MFPVICVVRRVFLSVVPAMSVDTFVQNIPVFQLDLELRDDNLFAVSYIVSDLFKSCLCTVMFVV